MIDTNILLEETLYSRKTQALSESLVLSEIEQYTQIKERLKEVGMLLEKYRLKAVESSSLNLPLHFTSTQLIPIGEGVSGSYFFKNEAGENKYVIKPVCEEPGGVNNPKYFWNASLSNPIREDMPLYLSSLKEAATYEFAVEMGLTSIAPKTALAIFESEIFYHITDDLNPKSEQGKLLLEEMKTFSREKLCSIQEVVPNSQPVFSLNWNDSWKIFSIASEHTPLEAAALTSASTESFPKKEPALESKNPDLFRKIIQYICQLSGEAPPLLDQAQYEELVMLIWLTYDTDAHTGNILAYQIDEDTSGNPVYGLKKIDNGLSFPTRNRFLRNPIIFHPNSENPLSEEGRKKITRANEDALLKILQSYGLDVVQEAFKKRLEKLKSLVQNPHLTLQEINSKLEALEYESSVRSYGRIDSRS